MRKPGLTGSFSITVAPRHTAAVLGTPGVDVLATPWLVYFCQRAAVEAIAGTLDDGEISIAVRSTLDHLAAVPPSAQVSAFAKLDRVEEHRLVFSVEARGEDLVVMRGTHDRQVVDRAAYHDSVDKG